MRIQRVIEMPVRDEAATTGIITAHARRSRATISKISRRGAYIDPGLKQVCEKKTKAGELHFVGVEPIANRLPFAIWHDYGCYEPAVKGVSSRLPLSAWFCQCR